MPVGSNVWQFDLLESTGRRSGDVIFSFRGRGWFRHKMGINLASERRKG